MPSPRPERVAIVHEWLIDRAGSERVLEQILALFPDATLYTLIDRMPAADRVRFPSQRTVTSFLDRWPGITRYFTRTLPLMPLAMQQFDLSGHDLVISSSHTVAKGVIVPPDALHLCYCHSPMRYVWDMQGVYLAQEGLDRGLKGWLARLLLHRLRLWDMASHHGADQIAANSHFVRRRIHKAWQREAEVIHPPVDVAAAASAAPVARDARQLVTVGRLMPYKNVALILEAMRQLPDWRLTVVGDGPQRRQLQAQAPANVQFTGPVTEADKQAWLARATAFVFAAVEDFGIAPAEALAAGTPVVALARGGALDYLVHQRNALLFAEATPGALAEAVRALEPLWQADPALAQHCRDSVKHLSEARFRDEFAAWVDRHWQAWCQALAAPR
jgi:glycosyltransferase involved in cell wall biosynthesis